MQDNPYAPPQLPAKHKRARASWIATFVLVPILYVLSIGPYSYFFAGRNEPLGAVIYSPLFWVARSNGAVYSWLFWYTELWTPKAES